MKSKLPPLFFSKQISKAENEYAVRMTEEESYLFLECLQRSIKCEFCGERFYSEVGYKMHGCVK